MQREDDITPAEMEAFLAEAYDGLDLLDRGIVRLEQEETNDDLLQEIFRAVHTLKGSASMLGLSDIAQLAHAMEDVLDAFRSDAVAMSQGIVDALLQGLDTVRSICGDVEQQRYQPQDVGVFVNALRACLSPDDPGAEPGEDEAPWGISVELGKELMDKALATKKPVYAVRMRLTADPAWRAVRAFQVAGELASAGDVLWLHPTLEEIERQNVGPWVDALIATEEPLDSLRSRLAELPDTIADAVEPCRPGMQITEQRDGTRSTATMRVGVDQLDALMNTISELVVDRSRMTTIVAALGAREVGGEATRDLADVSGHISRVVDDLDAHMMALRMVPIGRMFVGFPRLVRDLAGRTGKSVRLLLEGQETEIDRSVVERVREPVLHLLRNAVDHGIERPEERAVNDKPAIGTVKLVARDEPGYISVTVQDDGIGIDAATVRRRASGLGIASDEEIERMHDDGALELVFHPGFSTAGAITDVSGRGVGLDAVRRTLAEIGGSVTIRSTPGHGASFILRLPNTLSTVGALIADVGGTIYGMRLSHVEQTLRLEMGSIHQIAQTPVLRTPEGPIPLLQLAGGDFSTAGGAGVAGQFAVVTKAENQRVAIAVDRLIGQQEVVLKPLGRHFHAATAVAGACILGDGGVALILDIPALARSAAVIAQASRL
ncbi:MAG: chemotaxis protein CheA [Dehalococcoidia bacterium]